MKIGSVHIWMISPEDLIISKLWWAKESHSEMQFADIRDILQETLDIDKIYLEEWIQELKLSELYKDVADE